jgi:transposase
VIEVITGESAQETYMLTTHYVGLDIHKKTISFCVRQADGTILQEGTLAASCQALDDWLPGLPQPWIAGMEATMFTGWVYDHVIKYSPHVKNDRVDAQKISDLLRCNYFPECYLASREIRDRRRVLRYRNLLVRQSVQMKNRVSSMLMETGISYNKQKLHRRRYFNQLLEEQADAMPSAMPELLRLSRLNIDALGQMNKQLLEALKTDHTLAARVQRLMTIPGVGQVLSLTWALEMGDIARFPSVKDAFNNVLCNARKCGSCVGSHWQLYARMR